ncbi:MAG: hypothetical protein OXE84_03335 [Rhodobacteraceae bacterium]|nr:hypothetical protein [Paracoccaceae bacterium]
METSDPRCFHHGARFGILDPCAGRGRLAGVIWGDGDHLMVRHTGILLLQTSHSALHEIEALAETVDEMTGSQSR